MKKMITYNVIETRAGFFKGLTAFESKAEAERYFIDIINREFFPNIEFDEDDIDCIIAEKEASRDGDSYLLIESE